MTSFRPDRRAYWLLPIVLALCAVMVLPGSTFAASAASPGNPIAAAEGVASPNAGATSPSLHLPAVGASANPLPSSTSSVTSALNGVSFSQDPSNEFGPTASSLSSVKLPSDLANVPWAQAIEHPVAGVTPTTSLPNLGILEHPMSSVDGQVSPGYVAQPAPLGLSDYGLGAQTYAYNTSHIAGVVTFNAPPNASQPGGQGVVEPSLGGQHEGYVGSLYEFGVQLNTVAVNLTIPGTDDEGYAWLQNVVNWNDSALHFVQDTWNFSLDSDAYLAQNSLYSACDNDTAGANYILDVYGGVLQCVGGSIPLSPSDYPVTLTLYNNVTTNAQERSEVSYGYSLLESGTGNYLSGVISTVVFNNTDPSWQAPAPPPNVPGNSIDGFAVSPTFGPNDGFLLDAEIDLVGGIGGDNAVFRALNGSLQLEYSNESAGGWQSVPSAYNFGGDTGETSTGIADYWTPDHTLEVNQGPSMLYGLWGAQPQVSVASGDIQVSGSIGPSYGFVFISNTPPVDSPFAAGAAQDNMSWLPTNDSGDFNTYLPPLGGTWTSTYYVQAFASGSREFNGTVTGSTTSLHIHLAPAHGLLQAPLYSYTAAQAAALSVATGGSATPPYSFTDLTVGVNASFDHLNDYDYPSFTVFSSQGTGYGVSVTNVYQGTDNGTSAALNSYFLDYPGDGATGILVPGPAILSGLENYTATINLWNGVGDRVSDQTLFDSGSQGSQVVLWDDLDAQVDHTFADDTEYGVWVGDSTDTFVGNTTAEFDLGVTDLGSTGTTVWNELVVDALGVDALSSFDGAYDWINVTAFGLGVETGADFGPGTTYYYDLPGTTGLTITELNVTDAGEGANITFSDDTTFDGVGVYTPLTEEGLGIALDGDVGTVVNGLTTNSAAGLELWNASATTVSGWLQENYDEYYGGVIEDSTGTTLEGLQVTNEIAGPLFDVDSDSVVVGATVTDVDLGVEFAYQDGITASDLAAIGAEFAYEIDFATGAVSVSDLVADVTSVGLNVDFTAGAVVSGVDVDATVYENPDSAGVDFLDSTGGSISGVTATNDSVGARLFLYETGANDNTVTDVVAASGSVGVEVDGSLDNSISAVTATDGAIGVLLDAGASGNQVSNVLASDDATGVELSDATSNTLHDLSATAGSVGAELFAGTAGNRVSSVTATDDSAGVEFSGATGSSASTVTASGDSVGVLVDPSSGISVSGVSASDESVAVEFAGSTDSSATDISAVNASVGVAIVPEIGLVDYYSSDISATDVSVSNLSVGVYAEESGELVITGVTATNATLSSPWTPGFPGLAGAPIAAVLTEDDYQVQLSNVAATDYPIALYDLGSGDSSIGPGSLYVQGVSSTDGVYAIELNETESGLFSGVTATDDQVGALFYEAEGNDLVASSFTDCSSYGVSLWYSDGNDIWGNSFTGNNGATDTYSAAHIQAFSSYQNGFDDPVAPYTGNYWADWHSWNLEGALNPYYVGADNWDYAPLAVPAADAEVWFYESGLVGGTAWSVTLNGVAQTSSDSWMVFGVPAGTYSYSVGAVSGYLVAPASGSVTTSASGTTEIDLSYAAATDVVLTESGLASGTDWTATFAGLTESSTSATISFAVAAGTYAYQVAPIAGYAASPSSGSVTVSGATYALAVTFASTSTVVTFTETGLPAGTNWSATLNGVTEFSTTTVISFATVTGTYAYQVSAIAGYLAAPSIGTVTVASASYNVVVSFTPMTYSVTISSSGLPAGTSWSATVNGLTETTTEATLVWFLANGTYAYSISAPSGYQVANAGTSVTVNGAPGTINAAFSPTGASAYVTYGAFTTWVVVALVLAVIALAVALLAFTTRGKAENPPPAEWAGPTAVAPAAAATGSAGAGVAPEPAAAPPAGSPGAGEAPPTAPAPATPPAPAPRSEWDEEPPAGG